MGNFDFADVKPSVLSLLIVTLMAVVGITALKWGLNKWYVPGLSELINAV